MKLYVSNIPFSTDDDELKAFLIDRGLPVLDVRIVKSFEGYSRGFAFVEVGSDDKLLCIENFNGTFLHGRPLRCDVARERVRHWDDRRRDAAGE